jgi:hypothetical protein
LMVPEIFPAAAACPTKIKSEIAVRIKKFLMASSQIVSEENRPTFPSL